MRLLKSMVLLPKRASMPLLRKAMARLLKEREAMRYHCTFSYCPILWLWAAF